MRFATAAFGSVSGRAMSVALLVLACAAGPLAAQEVYKSVDAQGHVVYSDRGITKGAPKTAVHVDEPNPAEAARLAHEQQLLEADDAARARQQAAADKNKATQDRKKQQACEKARNQYFQMKDAARLYGRDAAGNRVYLSDVEADAQRETARRSMVASCGS